MMDVGWRFTPSKRENFLYFLKNKTCAADWICPGVSDCPNFYGENSLEPWELCGGGEEPLYFFTNRKTRGIRFDRKVGSGTWSESRSYPSAIGTRREFRYENGSDPSQNDSWLMHEFELSATDICVLCMVKKNSRSLAIVEQPTKRKNAKNDQPRKRKNANNDQPRISKKSKPAAPARKPPRNADSTASTSCDHVEDQDTTACCNSAVVDVQESQPLSIIESQDQLQLQLVPAPQIQDAQVYIPLFEEIGEVDEFNRRYSFDINDLLLGFNPEDNNLVFSFGANDQYGSNNMCLASI